MSAENGDQDPVITWNFDAAVPEPTLTLVQSSKICESPNVVAPVNLATLLSVPLALASAPAGPVAPVNP